ncbi:hypothetical protein BJX64DRAFT_53579 [Aspergillus heterothallicus]
MLLLHFLLLFIPLVATEGTVQDLWIFPQAPDFTSEITTGTTVTIRWHTELQAVFAQFCTECWTSSVDLWLTGTDFQRRIKAGLNVSSTFSYTWSANLNDSIVNANPDWSFRFLPSGAIWNGTGGQEISSSQFTIVTPDSTTTKSSTTTSTTSTSTSTSSTTTSTPTPTRISNNPSSTGLSTGAKAGIGIGAAAAGLLILAALAFFIRRHRRAGQDPIPAYDVQKHSPGNAQYQPAPGYTPSHRSMDVHEVSSSGYDPITPGMKGIPLELAGAEARVEMDGDYGQAVPRFELDASR